MSKLTVYPTATLNQFKFDGGKGKSACVPICIQALYHLHEILKDTGNILNDSQWAIVMERGTRVWELWRQQNPTLKTSFPRIEEIIRMKECEGFYQLFSQKSDEFDGLIMDSKVIENGQGPLQRVIKTLVKDRERTACAVVILPGHYGIALLSYKGSVFCFDPHGKKGTNNTELLHFSDASDVMPYLKKRYDLSNVDDLIDTTYMTLYDEEDIQNHFGYSATVFTVK